MVSHSKDRFSGKLLKSCNYTIERARIMYHKSQSTENMTIKSSRMDDVCVGNKETTSSFVKTWKLLHQRKSKIIEFVNEFSFFIILLTQTYFHILNLENMIHALNIYIHVGYKSFKVQIYLLMLSFENHFIPDYDDWWNYFCIRAHNGMVKVSIVLLQNQNHHRLTIIPPIRTRSHIKSCNIVCAMRIIL